jgi:membrane peptidoglycan carboxypeptidase
VPSLALGSAEVRPLDLVVAYAPFVRGDGRQLVPRFVTRVLNHEGALIYAEAARTRPGIDSVAALATRDLLAAVVDHGTGYPIRQSGFTGPAVGKTGTTNGSTDLWFVGGVWFGFDQPRAILGGQYGTGGQIAAPAWAAVMKAARSARRGRIEPWPGGWTPRYPAPLPSETVDTAADSLGVAADSAAAADSVAAQNDSAAANL